MINLFDILENTPCVIVMVGVPLSGKTTFIKENLSKYKRISMDEKLSKHMGNISMNGVWGVLKEDRTIFKKIHKQMRNELLEISKGTDSVVLDMLNIRTKTRWNHISKFKDHLKIAIVYKPPSLEKLKIRNKQRNKKEDNLIPIYRLEKFLEEYESVTIDEGFDIIINSESI